MYLHFKIGPSWNNIRGPVRSDGVGCNRRHCDGHACICPENWPLCGPFPARPLTERRPEAPSRISGRLPKREVAMTPPLLLIEDDKPVSLRLNELLAARV